jgi:hypothetical protein
VHCYGKVVRLLGIAAKQRPPLCLPTPPTTRPHMVHAAMCSKIQCIWLCGVRSMVGMACCKGLLCPGSR